MSLPNILLIILVVAFIVVAFVDIYLIPLFIIKAYVRKLNEFLSKGLIQEHKQYAAERFFKRKRAVIKLILGTHYIYSSALCGETDSRYETIVNKTDLKTVHKRVAEKYIIYIRLILAAAIIWFLKGEAENAVELHKKSKEASQFNPTSATPQLQSGLQICEIFLFEEKTKQFQTISKLIKDNEHSENLSQFSKITLYFRQYQLSGQGEYLEQCLAAITPETEILRNMILELASKMEGDAT